MHHKRRYFNTLKLSAYFYGSDITDDEKENAINLMQSNVDNYNGELGDVRFFNTKEELEALSL